MAKTVKKKPASAGKDKVKDGVIVRMFCQGLGDCFLITMPQPGKRPYSILIDCGVAKGTTGQEEIMKGVVRKIAELTQGVVDVLVVTHEHLDHVSGFAQAQEEFEDGKKMKIEFKNIWFAWTENGRDKLAQELKKTYGKAKLALARVRARIAAGNGNGDASLRKQRLAALDGVLAFHGMDGAMPSAAAKAAGKQGDVERAMVNLNRWASDLKDDDGLKYLMPGESLKLPGAASSSLAGKIQAYVLGPPHDRAKITRINPSKKTPETFEKEKKKDGTKEEKKNAAAVAGVNWSWTSAVLGLTARSGEIESKDTTDFDRSQPFDRQWRVSLEEADSWKDQNDSAFFRERYFAPESAGRRIDEDWLWSGAQRLALHIESYTNNTSLVLAFELPRSGKVLLFAADAQVGNWLSWHDQPYAAADGRELTAENLLAKTVLYKVGHHGSHNATLRERGLELMTHPELTALLPVEAEAVQRLGYGEMPLVSLVKALSERCHGRVLRLDESFSNGQAPGEWKQLSRATASQETVSVGKNGKKRPLYFQYVIRD